MQPMKAWPNGLVWYDEADLNVRNFLVEHISNRLCRELQELNKAIDFVRVETPCMLPAACVKAHTEIGFPLWRVSDELYLRPETTRGTYELFEHFWPQYKQLLKRLPVCLWQVGLSFRVEQDKTFSHMRWKQFYQVEFQLAYRSDTKADYHDFAVHALTELLAATFRRDVRTEELSGDDLPFYSAKTTDIYLDEHEVVAVSTRTDFPIPEVNGQRVPILEISCGLDRLTAIYSNAHLRKDD